ncbi:MAG: transcription termination/antitermination protein NusG [bacterium]
MAKQWYVVHTYSGHEKKVKSYLENTVAHSEELQDLFGQILIPTEEIVEMKEGKRRKKTRKFLPSYLLVEMEMTDEARHMVTSTPGVTAFVGAGGRPEPLNESEVHRVLGQVDRSRKRETLDVPYTEGEAIKVIDGPFKDFNGVVQKVFPDKHKVKVMVSIFGRSTPVELDFLQVEAID